MVAPDAGLGARLPIASSALTRDPLPWTSHLSPRGLRIVHIYFIRTLIDTQTRVYILHFFTELGRRLAKPDRRQKFVELAEKRVSKALKDLKLIGNLSNKSNYSYTDQDVAKIYRALKPALDEMKGRFESSGSSDEERFKL